ncbi:MAG: serine protease [Candidatus Nanopelagicales bacterium]
MSEPAPEPSLPAASASDGPGPRGRRPIWLAALAALIALLAIYGIWSRERGDSGAGDSAESPGGLLLESQAKGTSLTAVGRTRGFDKACTAWLLDVGAPAGAAAYAVTNGHCVGVSDSTAVLSDEALRGATIEFNAFAAATSDTQPNLVPAPVHRVVWASMRWTDLAVLQLGTSYGNLAAQGVQPIRPVAPAAQDEEILVAGVPVEGIPVDQQFLRGSRCRVGTSSDVIEFRWMWLDMRASDCTGMLGGSSGSPVFNAAGEAVGMVNTTTIGAQGGQACYLGQPCEVADGRVELHEDTTYMLAVDVLAGCFPEGRFALGGDCRLEDPAGVVPASSVVRVAQPGTTVEVELTGDLAAGAIANKQGRLASIDCFDAAGWEDAVEVEDWQLEVDLPKRDGWTLACVGSPEQPTPVLLEADGTAPDPADIELAQTEVEGGVRVEPVFDPPNLSAFRWVNGPAGGIDCDTAEGYTTYRRIPATIQADELPSTVCVIAIDEADNVSEPASIRVE